VELPRPALGKPIDTPQKTAAAAVDGPPSQLLSYRRVGRSLTINGCFLSAVPDILFLSVQFAGEDPNALSSVICRHSLLRSFKVNEPMEKIMIRAVLFAFALGSFATTASAMVPINQGEAFPRLQTVEQSRIICERDGRCYRPPGRRPVARWIYGDDAFSGSFIGPGNYGWPGSHSIWWPFGF
jgi:hypothetical protein